MLSRLQIHEICSMDIAEGNDCDFVLSNDKCVHGFSNQLKQGQWREFPAELEDALDEHDDANFIM